MRLSSLPSTLFPLLSLIISSLAARAAPKNAALLSSVSALTFRANKQTTSRRLSPIPQMRCSGPAEVCKLYSVDTIQCKNAGSDYDEDNVQWTCTANLPEEFQLGSTDVSCEGYTSSDDPYVLKGSCGVEYRLLLTDRGEERYGKSYDAESWGGLKEFQKPLTTAFFWLVFFAVVGWILWSARLASRRDRPVGPGAGFGSWGGGDGGGNDPPPPYDYHPPQKPSTRPSGTPRSSRSSQGGSGEQWRPGFWTGAIGGAAAGYVAGNRNSGRQQPTTGFFGGGNTNTRGGLFGNRNDNAGEGGSRSSAPSHSSSRYESTGFGSTSRR